MYSYSSLSVDQYQWNTLGLSYNGPNAYSCAEVLVLGLNKVNRKTTLYREKESSLLGGRWDRHWMNTLVGDNKAWPIWRQSPSTALGWHPHFIIWITLVQQGWCLLLNPGIKKQGNATSSACMNVAFLMFFLGCIVTLGCCIWRMDRLWRLLN